MSLLEQFHFLRPAWLLALIPLALLLWLARRGGKGEETWLRVLPEEFLRHLWTGNPRRSGGALDLLALCWLIAVLALAGPAWQRQPQPLQAKADHLVVLFDLSLSTLATDLSPNRLTRARQKLTDLLQLRQEGYTALVAYAGDSHLVSPLTDDTATIGAMVPALDPFIMPAFGSRPERAVAMGIELLRNAGAQKGLLLLMTDDMTADQAAAIRESLASTPYRLSVMAIGTAAGGPISIPDRGFLQGRDGRVVTPKVDMELLRRLASDSGGAFHEISLDNRDLETVLAAAEGSQEFQNDNRSLTFDLWRDEGQWLVWLLIPLALWLHRRGALLGLALLISLPGGEAQALEWQDLWKRRDQQAMEAYQAGDYGRAAELFEDPHWKGAAYYRAERYEEAAREFARAEGVDAQYNLGNALAQQQRFEEAIQAYERVLQQAPNHEQARQNKELLEKLLSEQRESQQPQQQGQQQDQQQPSSSDGSDPGHGQSGESEPSQAEQDSSGESSSPPSEASEEMSQSGGAEQDKKPASQEQQQAFAAAPENPDQPQAESQAAGRYAETELDDERRQAMEQWLRRVPDDPGGLLRRKFEMQFRERGHQDREPKDQPPW